MANKKLHFTKEHVQNKPRVQASLQIKSILQDFRLSDSDDDDVGKEKEPHLASISSSIAYKHVTEKEDRKETILYEKAKSNQTSAKLKSGLRSADTASLQPCEQLALRLNNSNQSGNDTIDSSSQSGKDSQIYHTDKKKSEVTEGCTGTEKKTSGIRRPKVARGKENVDEKDAPLSATPKPVSGSKPKSSHKHGMSSQPKNSLACQNMTLASLGISFDLSDSSESSDEEKHAGPQEDGNQSTKIKEGEVVLHADNTEHVPAASQEKTSTRVQPGETEFVRIEEQNTAAEVDTNSISTNLEKLTLSDKKWIDCKSSPQRVQLSECLIEETVIHPENCVDIEKTDVNTASSPFCPAAETVDIVVYDTRIKSELKSELKNAQTLSLMTDKFSPATVDLCGTDGQDILDTDVSMVRSSSSNSQCFFADGSLADESTGMVPLSESTRLDFPEGVTPSAGQMYPHQDRSHFVSSVKTGKKKNSILGKQHKQTKDASILVESDRSESGDFKLHSKEMKVESAAKCQSGIVSPTAPSTHSSGGCSGANWVKPEDPMKTISVGSEKRAADQPISPEASANLQNVSSADNSESVSNSQYLSCLSTPEDHSYYEAVDVATQTSFTQPTLADYPEGSPDADREVKPEKPAEENKEEQDGIAASKQTHSPVEGPDEANNEDFEQHSSQVSWHLDAEGNTAGLCDAVRSPEISSNQKDAPAKRSGDVRTAAANLTDTTGDVSLGDTEKAKQDKSSGTQPAVSEKTQSNDENYRRRRPSDSSSDDDGDAKLEAFFQSLRTPAKPERKDSDGSLSNFIVNDSDITESEEDICYADISRRLDFEETATRKTKKPASQRKGSSSARKKRPIISFSSSSDFDDSEETDDSGSDSDADTVSTSTSPPQAFSLGRMQTPGAGELKWYTPATSIKTKPRGGVTFTPSVKSISSASVPGTLRSSTFATPLLSGRSERSADAKCYSFLKSLSADVSDQRRDPEAKRFITQFKQRRDELSSRLFKLFNSTVFENQLPADMPVTWNKRLLKTAGRCKEKRIGSKREAAIELSVKVCDSAERVRDTLVHEMCHAAVWLINGTREGHGPHWKYWARKANRAHPEIPIIQRCHDYSISTKYIYRCVKCGYQIGRHSKSLDTDKKICGKCNGQFQLLLAPARSNSMTSDSSACPTPRTPRTPNRFAMFVKENYGSVKKQGLSHKEVMNLLSKDFAEKNKI